LAAGLALAALIVTASGCDRLTAWVRGQGGGPEQAAGAKAPDRPPTPVTAVAAVARDVPLYLDEIGRCAPRELVTIEPQVAGRIARLHFTDGAELKKG